MAIQQARAGDERAFAALIEPHRRELLLHCYRMLGSLQDAEDLVQETLLAAWRGLDGFEERASLRAWLYRIATNRCLNALRERGRRPVPAAPPGLPPATGTGEPLWLEPFPDHALPDPAPGPATRYEQREATHLAFVAGLQRLPARQRAALVLRDVLGFSTGEAATMLGTTPQAVKAALQRARAAQAPTERDRAPLPGSAAQRALVARFAAAMEAGDTATVVTLLTADARLSMPPLPLTYTGSAAIAAFLEDRTAARGAPFTLRAAGANGGQPAFACLLPSGPWGVLVLTLRGERIGALTFFAGAALAARFTPPPPLGS